METNMEETETTEVIEAIEKKEYDFGLIENKFHPDGKTKEKIIRTIKLGKSVDFVPDFNKPPQCRAYYLDNFLVYVDYNDRKKITNIYWNNKATKLREESLTTIELKKPLRIAGRDNSHIFKRIISRVVSKEEIINCLANGAQVKNFSRTKNPDGSHYVFYDRYYFFDDVCVVASETKNYLNLRTVYRVTAINDQYFLDMFPKLASDLKRNDDSKVKLSIVNNTARLKYLQSKEYLKAELLSETMAGNNPFVQGELLNNVTVDHKYLADQIFRAAREKQRSCGDIDYFYSTADEFSNIDQFELVSNNSYSLKITFDNYNSDSIDKQRQTVLREYGIDISKYDHELKFTNSPDSDLYNVELTIDFRNFSAAENPWAIRKNGKNVSFGEFEMEDEPELL